METSTIRIKIERRNGFFSNLGEPGSLQKLARFRKDVGLTGPQNDQLFAPYMIETQGRTTDFIRERAADLKRFLAHYDVRVLKTQKRTIKIAVNELHCPRVVGAEAKLRIVRETEESNEDSVEILGIGGGDEFKTSLAVGENLKVKGECVATIHSLQATFEWCEINTPDNRIQKFARLKELDDTSEVTEGVVLSPDEDECQLANFATRPAAKRETIDLFNFGTATLTKTLDIARGSKWTREAKIKLEEFGIDLGAKYVAQRTSKTELEYELVRGHSYVALKPLDEPFWLWQVK